MLIYWYWDDLPLHPWLCRSICVNGSVCLWISIWRQAPQQHPHHLLRRLDLCRRRLHHDCQRQLFHHLRETRNINNTETIKRGKGKRNVFLRNNVNKVLSTPKEMGKPPTKRTTCVAHTRAFQFARSLSRPQCFGLRLLLRFGLSLPLNFGIHTRRRRCDSRRGRHRPICQRNRPSLRRVGC